jgi:uncharacterized protein YjbJ (UPF0337 family)
LVVLIDAPKTGGKVKEVCFMNQEQFKGNWKQLKGELKKKWGQLTDNDLLETEGNYDKFLGIVQERYGDRKEEVTRWVDDWHERNAVASRRATESRNQR